jgi:hypothetical protein
MCLDCEEITIPIGPTGLKGDKGDIGDPGSNGTNGINGTSLLYAYNSITGVSTPNSTEEVDLASYTLLANELSTNGDEIELYIHYFYTANAITDTVMTLKIGGTSVYSHTDFGSTNNYQGILKINIARISSSSHLLSIERSIYGLSNNTTFVVSTTSTFNSAINNLIKITGREAGPVTAGTILLLKKFVVKKHKI